MVWRNATALHLPDVLVRRRWGNLTSRRSVESNPIQGVLQKYVRSLMISSGPQKLFHFRSIRWFWSAFTIFRRIPTSFSSQKNEKSSHLYHFVG
jgi:hypothetical protein